MLDADLKSQLQSYLGNLKHPITLTAYLDDSTASKDLESLLNDISSLSDLVSMTKSNESGHRTPSFTIQRNASDVAVSFAGIPTGHEFTSLVLALLHTGGHPIKLSEELIDTIRQLDGDYQFEAYISLSCQNCPDVVQALNMMSVINPRLSVITIDGALFQEEVEKRQIMAVPTVFMNGELFHQGRASIEELLGKLDSNSGQRDVEKLNSKDPFDVLVIGGGPAGAAAAIYAARKGIRTGLIAERFGGQVQDTMSIENFISVVETEGPKLSSALENHVKQYDVDLIHQQRVSGLKREDLVKIDLENGAQLSSKTVIIATGARWREMNVPGEQEYRNRGVAYCPHCDGPLFKGKRVAVIGGGNSGVEAAIDLAGLVAHVTLLEFDTSLRADEVLQRKLRSLPNVSILTQAQTTEVIGNGQKVTGLKYTNRETQSTEELELDGIFVQIGLVPNTEWLGDTLSLSKHKEIEVNARCETSMPGVFAAGDVTTVPYKQIIIAMGEGSKAALSAFDYLIRQV